MSSPSARRYARYALAGIRLVNGTAALLAPALLLRQLGVDPRANPAAFYALRMFGIRTVVLGAELLLVDGDELDRSLRNGILIHASDVLSAATAGATHRLPARSATVATLISTVNVGLAVAAREPKVVTSDVVDRLLDMSEAELDDLFRASPAGEIPRGEARGTVIAAPGTELSEVAAKLIHLIAWKGKVFDPDRSELLNKKSPLGIDLVRAKVYKAASWFDGNEAIILDYSRTSLVAHWIRDEIREIASGVYLGIVYWDRDKTINFVLEFPAA
jgi:hypothetical protein